MVIFTRRSVKRCLKIRSFIFYTNTGMVPVWRPLINLQNSDRFYFANFFIEKVSDVKFQIKYGLSAED